VAETLPVSNASGVPRGTLIGVRFSEAIRPESVNQGSFILEMIAADSSRSTVPGTVSPHPTDPSIFLFKPDSRLEKNTNYEAKLTTAIVDLAGNPLSLDYVWPFATTPDEG
jgi:hypothetical protein